jgi:hypothetical protein
MNINNLWGFRKVLIVATIGLAACGTQTGQDVDPIGTSTTATTSTTSTTVAAVVSEWPPPGPIEAGTYRIAPSAWTVADLTLTMPEGWETEYGSPGASKVSGQDGEVGFHFWIVDAIYSDPCVGSGGGADELTEAGPSVDDLATALLEQPFTGATGPVDTTLGGLPAQRIDLAIPDDFDGAACNIPGALQIWHSNQRQDFFVLLGDDTASVYILDVNGERQVFVTQHRAANTTEDITELQTIINSISIGA